MQKYLIGVDLGTSSTKAALYRPDGTLVAEASAGVPLYYPAPGVVEQENNDFYRTAAETVGRCLHESGIDPRTVAAIAFDSQMAGVGAIDENYEPAIRFDSWLDMRCQPYIAWLNDNHADLITRLTGCAPTCDHGPKILWWQNERPDDYRRVAKFVMPSAYVAGRMAGLSADQAFMDYTFIHFSGLADNRAGAWSAAICDTLGVAMDVLPEIVEPWRVIGEVTEAAARDFGLARGTPIAAGCGDTAANALGAGIVRPGQVLDVAGTASVLAGCTDRFVADTKHRALLTMRSVIPGLWNPLAYIAGGGQALRWFREQFTDDGRPRTDDRGRRTTDGGQWSAVGGRSSDEVYQEMIAQAAAVPPGSEGLYFSPHLGGRVCPATPEMRGAWLGFSWGHTRAHFVRAMLESVAYEYAWYLRVLREYIPNLALTEARVVGGGARSDAWNGIKADVLGVPYQRLARSEFGAWGAAMIAGKAVGIYDDLAATAIEHARPAGPPIQPSADNHVTYRPLVDRHIQLQGQLVGMFMAGGSSSRWPAGAELEVPPTIGEYMGNIRICMIGAGRVGKLHSGTLRRHVPGGEVVALVDPYRQILDATGDQFGIERRYASLEQALDAADFEAVVITTPTPTHRDLAVLAAEQGKHVFLEKPMALTLAECDDIMAATARHGVILQMGFMRRFDPDFAAAWERIQGGEIGEVMLIKSLTHGPGLPPAWATDLKTSNGNLAEVNSHDLDTCRWLTASTPLRMYVEVANFKGAERGVTSEHYYDNMFATVKFESGAMAGISGVCPCDYGYDSRVEIVGRKGIMQIGELKGESIVVCTDREQGLVTPIFRRWPDRFRWGYIRELEHFVDCVHAERHPSVTGEDGRWAVAMVLAGTSSFLEERAVYLSEVMDGVGVSGSVG